MTTTIEWTDVTWNPVTGCSKVSPGCDNCYMFALYPRLKGMGVHGYQTAPDNVRLLPERLTEPLRWKKPRLVFVNSMSDVFHRDVPFSFVAKMMTVMKKASEDKGHIFQILTKRPGRAAAWWNEYSHEYADGWPPGIWLGTSIETQKYAPRIDVLARVPAPVRFISAEPLLGPLDLRRWLDEGALHWVIVGGESGRAARPMAEAWARDLANQCESAGVPMFLKQFGAEWAAKNDSHNIKGSEWNDWPVDLRVRLWPSTRRSAQTPVTT